MNEKEQKETKAEEERIRENGQVTLEENGKRIHLLSIIGEIEGHDNLSGSTKTTKYEHILPELAKVESDEKIGGVLILVNTIGGDVSCGLALAEMIASGVTCAADMYMRTGVIARQVLDVGISANLSCGGVYFGPPEDFSPEDCSDCKNQQALTRQWHGAGDGQILVDASIHAEYTSSPPLWQWMADFARDYGLRMHAHISETASEHQGSLERRGLTPIQALDRCGVWENGGIAAHCVYTTAEDWAIMAAKDVSCVHNPWSNLKLGSGVAPIPDMLRAGVNIALGTDGMSSHNSADFFSDLKLAACLHKGIRQDPTAVTARQALYMATAGGALALGRRDTGRIVPGYRADLILVDFEAANLVPCHDIAENLVFAAHGANVVMNMARGKVIYKDGAFLTLDLDAIKSEVRRYALPLVFGGSPTT